MSDVATMMLDTVSKFSEKHQTSDLTLTFIQIVIFDARMCDGFAQALESAVKGSRSVWGRAKRKSAELYCKLLQRVNSNDDSFKQCVH